MELRKTNETLMDQVTLRRDTLRRHLNWHGARLSFLVMFLIALLQVKAVNGSDLAVAFCSRAQSESSYKRLQRFFRDYEFDESALIREAVHFLSCTWVRRIKPQRHKGHEEWLFRVHQTGAP